MPASLALKPAEHAAADGRLFFDRFRKAPGGLNWVGGLIASGEKSVESSLVGTGRLLTTRRS